MFQRLFSGRSDTEKSNMSPKNAKINITFTVSYSKDTVTLEMSPQATLRDLGDELQKHFSLAPQTVKLLVPGVHKTLFLQKLSASSLTSVGIKNGSKCKVLGSSSQAVHDVQNAKDLRGMASFDHEAQRAASRSTPPPPNTNLPSSSYTFAKFEVWNRPGLTPPPTEALKLLHQLAADGGIQAVMQRHQWKVGLLSEMPPQGKVGVSPVCILGVNVNKGQEISLRLRTDDLKGFRKYDKIKETLCHELAHMVHSDHDAAFKQLNSKLRQEAAKYDWRSSAGARTTTGGVAAGATYSGPPVFGASDVAGAGGARPLRDGLTVGGATTAATVDPRQAAREAALNRAGQQPPPPTAVAAGPPKKPGDPIFKKGDYALYRQRDGTKVPVQIVHVDVSIVPPSYGIKLDSTDPDSFRETEESRLTPVEEDLSTSVEGIGHEDVGTRVKEDQVKALET